VQPARCDNCTGKLANKADVLAQCLSDARKCFALVRGQGVGAYDADATEPGVQTTMPDSTTPKGGARSNVW
jgi:hypothetical protein